MLYIAYNKLYNKRRKGVIKMLESIVSFTDRLIPISVFSQGKASQIINEVFEKNIEYIILKNNLPTAVLVSVEEYKKQLEEIASLRKQLEKMDEMRLLTLAAMRKGQPMTAFEDLIAEEGINLEEIATLSESVEIE